MMPGSKLIFLANFRRLFLALGLWLFFVGSVASDPECSNLGKLFYLGTDGSATFWLSIAKAKIKDAQLQGPLGQIVDNFSLSPHELHVSASPYTGVHSLFNIKNSGPCLVDTADQRPDPPELPGFPEAPGGETPSGGFGGSAGGNVLSQLVLNVNKNFLTTYFLPTYGVSERIENALFRCDDDLETGRWQFWAEPRYIGLNSRIATGVPKADSRNLQIGAGYNFNSLCVLGLSAMGNDSKVSAFAGSLENKNRGIIFGPYLGLKMNNIILDTWLTYGYNDVKSHLVFMKGHFLSHSAMIAGNISTIFELCNYYMLQPKMSVFYAHMKTDKFTYSGRISSFNVRLNVGATKFEYARAAMSFKLFKEFMCDQVVLIPSILAGVNNNFILPDHKHYLKRNVEVASRKPWNGLVQAGIGARVNESLRLDFLAGYYSLGVREKLWDARLSLNYDI